MASDISERLRAEVTQRADHRCEYCFIREEDSAFLHQIDHIISRKHGGTSAADNLALACVLCNRHKGSDVSSVDGATGAVTRIFNPRRDTWYEHFQILNERIEPLTAVGRVTVHLLRVNAPERLAERRLLQQLGVYPLG